MASVPNALVPALTKVGLSLDPHYEVKRDLYKGSPICHFFILLQAGAEADTHKDPFQPGIIYHAIEIQKRQSVGKAEQKDISGYVNRIPSESQKEQTTYML